MLYNSVQMQKGHLLSFQIIALKFQIQWMKCADMCGYVRICACPCIQSQFAQCFTQAIFIRICWLGEQWPTTFATTASTAGANPAFDHALQVSHRQIQIHSGWFQTLFCREIRFVANYAIVVFNCNKCSSKMFVTKTELFL